MSVMRPAPTLWAEEAPIEPPWLALEADTECQFLVIGAGLAGLAIAGELTRRGADVLVIDEAAPGAGASARNAGFVLVAHVWEHPAIRARVGAEGARALIAIARRTHQRIERDFGTAVGHRRCGSLMLPVAGDETERAVLERAAASLTEDGVGSAWVAPPDALQGFGRALSIFEDGEVHPGALIEALAQGVKRHHIARIDSFDPVARIASAGAFRIRFERVIVATNAWTGAVVPELDGIITPHRAQVLVTAPLPMVLDRPCYANYGYDYFRQRPDGSLVLGGRRHLHREREATDDARPTSEVQGALDAFLGAHLPFTEGTPIARRWAGIMGLTPDSVPLVGPLPRAPESVSLIAGFSGHGVGLAIGCAELLADQLAGTSIGSPAPPSPVRAPGALPSASPRASTPALAGTSIGSRALPSVLDPARFPTILRAR